MPDTPSLTLDQLRHCTLCPRECGADRMAGPLGYCRTGVGYALGSICQHRGEEPVVGGPQGICNLFFTRCNLQCGYCQNFQISRTQCPILEFDLTLDDVIEKVEATLDQGVQAVGFVSPSHVLPQIKAIMDALEDRGRRPAYVYNSNGYDKVSSLRDLAGRIPVYLPDLKYMDAKLAERLSDAPRYPEFATQALKEMARQVGNTWEEDDQGGLKRGMIVRHLVIPGQIENSKQVLRFIARELPPEVRVSLMSQYTPIPIVKDDPELGRTLRTEEYDAVREEMDRLGLERGWVQELDSQGHYSPDFKASHPFER